MFYQRKGLIPEAEKEQAKARMLNWKQELKTNPNAPPPETQPPPDPDPDDDADPDDGG